MSNKQYSPGDGKGITTTTINLNGVMFETHILFDVDITCAICGEKNKAGLSITNDAETIMGCNDPNKHTGSERWTDICFTCIKDNVNDVLDNQIPE